MSITTLAAGPFEATTAHARSFEDGIFLTIIGPGGLKGWTQLSPQGVAICAAAQAASKHVFFTYDHHDPNWGNNTGYFFGVKVALSKESF